MKYIVLLQWQEFATRSVAVLIFLTCHRGAGAGGGGEYQLVSGLGLLNRNRQNRWMSQLPDPDRSRCPGLPGMR